MAFQVITKEISQNTKGAGDLIDLTVELKEILHDTVLSDGLMTVFVVGSTASITTFEYESGLIHDMKELYERIAPSDKHYQHNETWNDDNGASHVRAALQGQSISIPFVKGSLVLGTWQQVVLAEFDVRPRKRQVVVQMTGI
jgi:secondary thiamine-phosphate synthase enzyme